MRRQAFKAVRDGLTIAGTKYCPGKNANGIPVIVSHGFLVTRKSVAGYAGKLAEWGYTAYTFDFIGGAPRNGSGGRMTDMSVLTEMEDLRAVMEYVRKDGCDYEKLILMGCSQGGFVSAMTAAAHPDEVKKLILFYPALCIPDDARRGSMMFFHFDPENVPETMTAFTKRMAIGRRYVLDAQKLDALEAIAPYDGEVLIVHGTADRIVDIDYSRQARERFAGRARLFAIENAGHGFKGAEDRIAAEVVREFLSGREEVLTVDVRLTGSKKERRGLETILTLPFEGTVSGPYFEGKILPGAADVQRRRFSRPVEFCARYTAEGTECAGKPCKVTITNRTADGRRWVPRLETDSEALHFLNAALAEAVLEYRKTGPIVHIFAK